MKNKVYKKQSLENIHYPLGGIGAGMFCIDGIGNFTKLSINHHPDLFNMPNWYATIRTKTDDEVKIRLVEGQLQNNRIWGTTGGKNCPIAQCLGTNGKMQGLPRFIESEFTAEFPFANVKLTDKNMPIDANIEAYSPFIPSNDDDSSLPFASVKYSFTNTTEKAQENVFTFNARKGESLASWVDAQIIKKNDGFVISYRKSKKNNNELDSDIYFFVNESKVSTNVDWYKGSWFDSDTMRWKEIKNADIKDTKENKASDGAAMEIPFTLQPGETKEFTVNVAWYTPQSEQFEYWWSWDFSARKKKKQKKYSPWYATRFSSVEDVVKYVKSKSNDLYADTQKFTKSFYETKLPSEMLDAIASNLTILKSPTVLRQFDGRIWGWEGCRDTYGSCHGSCTHVWNYAQAMSHLFPNLERTFRQTEFGENLYKDGRQNFRSNLPIQVRKYDGRAAADGQLGTIMKFYREWKIKGDNNYLVEYYDRLVSSIDYCIRIWDTKLEGVLKEPHHNTYDIEFWGADSMCSSYYLGALKAMTLMGKALNKDVSKYDDLYKKGKEYVETKLWNGEYFVQQVQWTGLTEELKMTDDPKMNEVLKVEGPKYQYKNGCLSDGLTGAWLAKCCGLGDILDVEKTKKHLLSVYKYNFKKDFYEHENAQRSLFGIGQDGGLLLCTWPNDDKPSIPFVYSDEVWTGIEYAVASHLLSFGFEKESSDIVSTLRARYDGVRRNPYDEYECGHWYARAMASYALLLQYSGFVSDMNINKLTFKPQANGKFFWSNDNVWGLFEKTAKKLTINVDYGKVKIKQLATDFDTVTEIKYNSKPIEFSVNNGIIDIDIELSKGDNLSIVK